MFISKLVNTRPEIVEYHVWLVQNGFNASYDVAESIYDGLTNLGRDPKLEDDINAICEVTVRDINDDSTPALQYDSEENYDSLGESIQDMEYTPSLKDIADVIVFADMSLETLEENQLALRACGYDVSLSETASVLMYLNNMAEVNHTSIEAMIESEGSFDKLIKGTFQSDMVYKGSVKLIHLADN